MDKVVNWIVSLLACLLFFTTAYDLQEAKDKNSVDKKVSLTKIDSLSAELDTLKSELSYAHCRIDSLMK